MDNPSISVVIPMFNAELTITRCLDSVLSQEYNGNIEVIVVDDGSTDNSVSIVKNIIKSNHSNFTIKLLQQENHGVSSARNCGIKNSKNDLIALLDSDDAWYSKKISTQVLYLIDFDIDFIAAILSSTPWKRYLFRKVDKIIKISLYDLLFKFCFQPSTVLFKREIIKKVGYFNEDYKYAEEGEYFMRIVFSGYNCFLLNEKLTYFGLNNKKGFGDGGLSGNIKEMQKGEIRNHKFALENYNIPYVVYLFARIFSQLKYFRRKFIVYFKL